MNRERLSVRGPGALFTDKELTRGRFRELEPTLKVMLPEGRVQICLTTSQTMMSLRRMLRVRFDAISRCSSMRSRASLSSDSRERCDPLLAGSDCLSLVEAPELARRLVFGRRHLNIELSHLAGRYISSVLDLCRNGGDDIVDRLTLLLTLKSLVRLLNRQLVRLGLVVLPDLAECEAGVAQAEPEFCGTVKVSTAYRCQSTEKDAHRSEA